MPTPKRGHAAGAAILVAAFAALVASCDHEFSGPYACNPGYASCTTPDQCETDLTSNPGYCGSCGASCPQGALCANSACTQAPPTLSKDVNPAVLALNSTDLFYWSVTSGLEIVGLPKSGGAEFPMNTPNQWQQGNQTPFAVDDTRLYYLAQNNLGSPGQTVGVDAVPVVPADGGAPVPTVLATFPMTNLSGSLSAMVLSGGTLFMGLNMSSGGSGNAYQVSSVPVTGGAVTSLATFSNVQTIAIDAQNIYAIVTPSSGSCTIERVPVTGGTPSMFLDTQSPGCPSSLATDGNNVYLANATSSYGNNNDNNNATSQCLLQFLSVPTGGGAQRTLGQVTASEQALRVAVDGSNLYVVTDQSVWKVPITGGAVSRIAGNLQINKGGGSSGGPSGGGCPTAYVNPTALAIALDDTSLYLAEGNLLLKIPK